MTNGIRTVLQLEVRLSTSSRNKSLQPYKVQKDNIPIVGMINFFLKYILAILRSSKRHSYSWDEIMTNDIKVVPQPEVHLFLSKLIT